MPWSLDLNLLSLSSNGHAQRKRNRHWCLRGWRGNILIRRILMSFWKRMIWVLKI